MAFQLAKDRAIPVKTMVSEYTVRRSGRVQTILIKFEEVVCVYEELVSVTLGSGNTLTVPAWEDRTDLVGRMVELENGVELGEVLEVDGDQITLSGTGLNVAIGKKVTVPEMGPFASVVYEKARQGRTWEVYIPLISTEAVLYAAGLMGTAHFKAVRSVLDQLGNSSITNNQIGAAIQALGAAGTNLDGFLAQAGEKVEQDRQGGNLPDGVTVIGHAPFLPPPAHP